MDPMGLLHPFSLRNEQKESPPQKKWRWEEDGKAQALDIPVAFFPYGKTLQPTDVRG